MFSGRVVYATLLLYEQGAKVGIPFFDQARYNGYPDRHVTCLFGGDVGEGKEL